MEVPIRSYCVLVASLTLLAAPVLQGACRSWPTGGACWKGAPRPPSVFILRPLLTKRQLQRREADNIPLPNSECIGS